MQWRFDPLSRNVAGLISVGMSKFGRWTKNSGLKRATNEKGELKMEFSDYLLSIRACEDARSWCKNKTLSEAWNTCERGDWLLWLAAKHMDKPGWPTRKQIVLAACACAETAQKFANDNGVSANTLKIVRLWANGEATIEQVREARRAFGKF